MIDSRTREELVAEALRLLDLATAKPVEPAPDEPDGYSAEAIDVLRGMRPTRPAERFALPAAALTDEEATLIQASEPVYGERYKLADVPEDPLLYPSEDGPGAGRILELTVRVLVGTERSTVIVAMGRDDPFILREVRDHGREIDGIGQTVEAALRDALPPGDNSQGLSTLDPMTDPSYRAVARRIAERHDRDYGRGDPKQTLEESEGEAD